MSGIYSNQSSSLRKPVPAIKIVQKKKIYESFKISQDEKLDKIFIIGASFCPGTIRFWLM